MKWLTGFKLVAYALTIVFLFFLEREKNLNKRKTKIEDKYTGLSYYPIAHFGVAGTAFRVLHGVLVVF